MGCEPAEQIVRPLSGTKMPQVMVQPGSPAVDPVAAAPGICGPGQSIQLPVQRLSAHVLDNMDRVKQ
ncbi:hypothetical protein D3C86_2186190 [compost metagenome]